MKPRHVVLMVALFATLALVWQLPVTNEPTEVVENASRPLKKVELGAASGQLSVARMTPGRIDLFEVRDWRPKPQAVVVDIAAEEPKMPPLPYRYLGRWEENGTLTLFLSHGNEPIPIHLGQVLDGVWRVELVRPDRIEFTYLPLNTRAMMALEIPS